jgi:hypothetical protein
LQTSPDRLRELAAADKDGRVSLLQLNIGDTVYSIAAGRVTEMTVGNIFPFGIIEKGKLCNYYLVTKYTYLCATNLDIGKIVFLTRAEAEDALKGGAE